MSKCPHCPLAGSPLDCPAYARPPGWAPLPQLCDLADPTLPGHDPRWREKVVERAEREAGGSVPENVPRPAREGPEPALPSLPRMAVNYAVDTLRHVAGGLKEAPPEVQAERLGICGGCELFRDGRCRHPRCGCFMAQKVERASARCPIGKWAAWTPPRA